MERYGLAGPVVTGEGGASLAGGAPASRRREVLILGTAEDRNRMQAARDLAGVKGPELFTVRQVLNGKLRGRVLDVVLYADTVLPVRGSAAALADCLPCVATGGRLERLADAISATAGER